MIGGVKFKIIIFVRFLLIGSFNSLISLVGGESNPAEILNKNLIESSVPTNLRECSIVVIQENQVNDHTSRTILDLVAPRDKFLLSFKMANQSDPTYSFEINTKSNYSRVVDVYKLRNPCVVAFVQVVSKNIDFIYQLLLERLTGVTKKDEDYFIFHSESRENLETIFSRGSIATGVKNKLGVALTSESTINSFNSNYISACFYCSATHEPSLKEIATSTAPQNDKTSGIITLFPDYLQTFSGKEFTVASPILAKWLIEIEEISPGSYKARRGFMHSALEHLMVRFNFTGKYFPSMGGGGTGYRFPNGSWIGTVGDIVNGRAELAQTTGQILSRNAVVGFSFPICYEWLTFTTGEPQRSYSPKAVFWPFSPLMWFFVTLSIFISFVALTTLLNVAIEGRVVSRKLAAGKAFSYLIRTFLEQDATSLETTRPRTGGNPTTRVFIGFWLLFALVVATAYRSKLVSVLAFPQVEEPPKTFEALATSTTYQIALQYLRGAAYYLMKTSPNPTFQTIFNKMELEENDARCFQRCIGAARFSCISWDSVASYVAHKNLSDKYGQVPLVKATDTSSFIAIGIIFKKRAVFRTKFDKVICRAWDMGLMWKWKELDYDFIRNERAVWENAMNITKVVYSQDISDELKLDNLLGTFLLWMTGLVMGLTGFFMERLVYWWKWKFKRDNDNEKERSVGSTEVGVEIRLLQFQSSDLSEFGIQKRGMFTY